MIGFNHNCLCLFGKALPSGRGVWSDDSIVVIVYHYILGGVLWIVRTNTFYWVNIYTIHCHTPSHRKIHCLVHCLATKLMVHPLVLHIVWARKAVLVCLFLFRACDTCVPILHVEATSETNILVCPRFNKVCELWAGWLAIWESNGNVWNHLIPTNVLCGCQLAPTSSSPGVARAPTSTTTTSPFPALLVLLLVQLRDHLLELLLVTLKGRGRKMWGARGM